MNQLLNSNTISFIEHELEQKVQEVKNHAAWHAEINLKESESLLNGKKAFTFLLRATDIAYHYTVSFVDQDNMIQHRPIRIQFSIEKSQWCFLNCGPQMQEKLNDLIPSAILSNGATCTPLKRS